MTPWQGRDDDPNCRTRVRYHLIYKIVHIENIVAWNSKGMTIYIYIIYICTIYIVTLYLYGGMMWVHIVFIVYIYKYIHICNDLLDDGCELWLAIWLGIWARPKLLRIPMKSLFNFAKHEKTPPPLHSSTSWIMIIIHQYPSSTCLPTPTKLKWFRFRPNMISTISRSWPVNSDKIDDQPKVICFFQINVLRLKYT